MREKTPFVAINNFDCSTMRNDFHFLEDVLQAKVTAKRLLINSVNGGEGSKRTKRGSGRRGDASPQQLAGYPAHVQKLHDACKERATTVLFVPNGMTKRGKNTSYYRIKEGVVEWRVHLVFVIGSAYEMIDLFQAALDVTAPPGSDNNGALRCENSLLGISVDCISEQTSIRDLLDKLFLENNLHRYALRHLKDSSAALRCFLQRIPSPQANPIFYLLDASSSLRECLAARTVLEYPTIFVGTAANTARFKTFIQNVESFAVEGVAAAADGVAGGDDNAIDIDEVGGDELEEEEEEEEEDEEEQKAFFQELQRFQDVDVAKLQEIIRASEAETLAPLT